MVKATFEINDELLFLVKIFIEKLNSKGHPLSVDNVLNGALVDYLTDLLCENFYQRLNEDIYPHFSYLKSRYMEVKTLTQKNKEERVGKAPTIKDRFLTDINLSNLNFRDKPVSIDSDYCNFFFKETNNAEYWIEQTKKDSGFYLEWLKIENSTAKHIHRKIPCRHGLEVKVKNRDSDLIKVLQNHIDKSDIEIFLEELGVFINENHEIIYPIYPDLDDETEVIQENMLPESFEDYPEDIQESVNKIIKSFDPLKALIDAISIVHIGDIAEVEFLILKEFTPHILNAEPVHCQIAGSTDTGKTDLVKHVSKIVPERYQLDIQTLSSKALYYDDNLRDDHNHIVINDFLDSPDALGLIKVMTDNLTEKKQHKTVIENEGVTLDIPGRNTITITAAKDINDPETERRFLKLNPQEDKNHQNNVKKFLKSSGITGTVNQGPLFQICQATFDKLTKKPLNVFNPWIDCIDLENKGFTDIKIFINLVKARAIIFQENRISIDDNTILGSKEDVLAVIYLWEQIAPLQQYKLSKKQVELLKLLPLYDSDIYIESRKAMRQEQGTLEGVVGITYTKLAKDLGKNRNTIYSWVNGYYNQHTQASKPGLVDLGFIIKKQSNPDMEKSSTILFLDPDKKEYVEGLNEGFTLVNDVEKDLNIGFSGGNPVKKIAELFFTYVKNNIEVKGFEKIPKIEYNSKDVKNDEDVYKIICLVQETLNAAPEISNHPVEKIINTLNIPKKNQHTTKQDENHPIENQVDCNISNQDSNNDDEVVS